jgi:predicted heme/steroid binding protein
MGSKAPTEPDHHKFGFVDLLRIGSGLLVLNYICSWWFTSSYTWGYHGRWLNSRYIQHKVFNNYVELTLEQLSMFNGTDSTLPIYIAINGLVYDVTGSPTIYGPNGAYSKLAGKDAARVYVTGCLDIPEQYTYDLRGLLPDEVSNDISQWQNYFANHNKYWYVGTVHLQDISGPPPEPCSHMKHPSYYNS